jgi:hypothetical protein
LNISNEFTKEESELIRILSKSPQCMHPPENIIENEHTWKCEKCGLLAPKITQVYI